jgi:hypothetical protein
MRPEAESNRQKAPTTKQCLALGGLLVTCLNGSAARGYARMEQVASVDPQLKLRVRVCNYAAVPAKTVASAELLTTEIFQAAGVKTVWVHDSEIDGVPIRAESPRSEPAPDIDLRILTAPMGSQLGFAQEKLGFALECASGEGACYASVFYQRVEKLAGQAAASLPRVLACVFAHEIGHLLLGVGSHSKRGIMRAEWNPADFNSADLRGLLFTPSQVKLIQANVRERSSWNGLASTSDR